MKLPFFKSSSQAPVLRLAEAEQILNNVLNACGRQPNSVPLETMISYSNYRKERYGIQRTLIAAMLALFLLLPILFFAAEIRVQQTNIGENANPIYAVSVSGRIPIFQIRAEMDGRTAPLYEISENEYMLQPRENGEVRISVRLMNRQETAIALDVNSVDREAPQLISSDAAGEYVYLNVQDADSGVDFEGIRIVYPDGNSAAPAGYDAQTGRIQLEYPQCALTVRIPDRRGNALQIKLKPAE